VQRNGGQTFAGARMSARRSGLALLLLCLLPDSKALPQTAAIPGSHHAQRVQAESWFLRGRAMPGESAARLRQQAHLQKQQMRLAAQLKPPSPQLPAAVWTSLGPAPLASDASGIGQQDYNWVSGRATAVAIDPADASANTVYVGGAYGGVWKSTNAAASGPASVTWTPLIDNQATLAVGAIAIQPQLSNPNPANSVILVGTGEANSSADSYYGLGILRSANAGSTWTMISADTTGTHPFAGLAFSKIAFSTSTTSLAVAGAAGASEGILEGLASSGNANLGLYYSQNAGASWTYANVQDGTVTTAADSATSVVYNAVAGQFFARDTLSRVLFLSGRNQLDAAPEPTRAWTHLARLPRAIEQHDLPDLSGRDRCRARSQ
jgi:hypothetical protein